ncbi:MAG: flagellar biosynthetic protein FliO [Chloroflexi bacterium]|nr:flagellar biosynthetic protein FliO [Chloroflexota bacterium]
MLDLPSILERLRREIEPGWRRLIARHGLPKLLLGIGVVLVVLLALFLPTSGTDRADPFESPGAALDLLLKLGAVLALAYVSLAALRRYSVGMGPRRGSLLEVLDSTSLGQNRSVYVVRAGDKRLVLGVTPQQITTLSELDPGATAAEVLAPEVRMTDQQPTAAIQPDLVTAPDLPAIPIEENERAASSR